LIALLFASPYSTGQDQETARVERRSVPPELNERYLDPDVERWTYIFENPAREVFEQRFRIVQQSGVVPGMSIADIGAGTGFFTMLFARAVGPMGKVYAVDISPGFVDAIEKRAAEYRVDNVEAVVNDTKSTGLPPDSIDLAFLCDTYHHFEYPRAMLESIAQALREDGELLVIDFRRILGVSSPWIMSHVRAGEQEVTEEILSAGFDLVERYDFLRENFFLRFRKRPSPVGD
jgi:ubiquinone/menaquinone biosynthesis C-methylase UbiE